MLVGADVADELGRRSGRRDATACTSSAGATSPDELFRDALALGAENVAGAAGVRAPGWSSRSPTSATPARPAGLTFGVVGGSGGAGATTFACALGQLAAPRPGPPSWSTPTRSARASTGCSGLEATRRGPVGRALPDHRPAQRAVAARGAAAPGRARGADLDDRPARLAAGRSPCARRSRPRSAVTTSWWSTCPGMRDPLVDEVVARCDRVLVVVAPTVRRGVASAARLCAGFAGPVGAAAGASGAVPASTPRDDQPGDRGARARGDGRPARAGRVDRPRRSGRCGPGAGRSAARRSAVLDAERRRSPAAADRDDRDAESRSTLRRRGPRAAGPRRPAPLTPHRVAEALREAGPPGRRRDGAGRPRGAAPRRRRRRPARAAAAARPASPTCWSTAPTQV